MSRALLILAPFTLLSSAASAQVLITEVQSDPSLNDDAEWIELQNVGTASVSLEGWTLNDYVGTTDPANESGTRWIFPQGAALEAGEVIVVTNHAIPFLAEVAQVATWEMEGTDPLVPNLIEGGDTGGIQLGNSGGGDAVVLRDEMGNIVSYVEWGTLDRAVPGTPFTSDPPAGSSLIRVDVTGNSADDWIITMTPTPFVGFMSSQTMILGTTITPRHVVFGSQYNVSTMVTDEDGINSVEIFFSTATSSSGNAVQNYISETMTSTDSTYTFSGQVQTLGGGFTEPLTFHERYLRFYIQVEDNNNDLTTEPPDADEGATNPSYLPSYVQNILPNEPTPIAEAREGSEDDMPDFAGHSVRVRGIALVGPRIMEPTRTLFTVQDDSGAAIAYFSTSTVTPAFAVGDELILTGELGSFLGSTQISNGQIEVTGATSTVSSTTLTIAEALASGEDYEAQLVTIEDVDFVEERDTWPDDENDLASWNVVVTDGSDEITLRVTSTTDLFGQAAPQFGFAVTGVLNEREDGDWQIFPRSAEDIVANAAPQMDAGVPGMDATVGMDTGVRPDAGTPDTGTGGGVGEPDDGCDCSATDASRGSVLGVMCLGLLLFVRKRR